jgi:flagellar motility protein MotE (MotC chaperone)
MFWLIAVVSFFGGAVAVVFSGDDAGSSAVASEDKGDAPAFTQNADEPHAAGSGGCLADSATLEDLRRQRAELEAKQKELGAREAELKTREQALADQLKTLTAARDDLEKAEQARQAEGEAKVAKLVETVENMNPKAGAQLLASIDEALAASTMARLSTGKLAKIMNVMDPARSTRLSEVLAGVARAKPRFASHDAAVATNERVPAGTVGRASGPSKGGDTNDGKSHDQASNRSTADGGTGTPQGR